MQAQRLFDTLEELSMQRDARKGVTRFSWSAADSVPAACLSAN